MKALLRDLTPPVVWRLLKRWRDRLTAEEWQYVSDHWPAPAAQERPRGWGVPEVLEAYKARWPGFVKRLEGPEPFVISPEAFQTERADLIFHNTLMSFAYALLTTAQHKASLSMLDWGGGIGHYYLLSRALAPDLELDYHSKDLPGLAAYGQQFLPDQHFYSDDTCLNRQYDLVLASASLHYSPDWEAVLQRLAGATRGRLFVTRLPIVPTADSFVFVQRPYAYGYNTEYLAWCLNRRQFLQQAQRGQLTLVREFVTGEQPRIAGAPEQCQYRGYLFCPASRQPPG
ncbi:MAG: hypothetical protein IT318_09990 [Anaerolineales bacterium]|nr:hypothetical protein [Anaerolineales bacterium]